MNHIEKIAAKLADFGLDAMMITSESGERYALGFHGEGLLLVTREGAQYTTDGRYIEAARAYGLCQGVYRGQTAAQRGL